MSWGAEALRTLNKVPETRGVSSAFHPVAQPGQCQAPGAAPASQQLGARRVVSPFLEETLEP